ncbi:MAG: hypothetical protein WAW85_01345 [Gordonia sp. (in: high G+C Gram-positive bacteria)]|uniref:hypothetical protein n=1 Tax=Gordonia sp. (in: high G+C Gram-positive bacteria) TaxID=84139 RepID=UPI003BB75EF4
MPTWITVVFILLIVATLASFLIGRSRSGVRGGAAAGYESGSFTVTGVSGRGDADKNGAAYCTVSGTIIGAATAPTEVYGTLVLGTGDADPVIGQELPVIYKPGKKATTWRFGTLGA